MFSSTDKLAFALATPEPITRRYFRSVFDHLYLTDAVTRGYGLEDIVRHRRATEANLEALAVCDFSFSEHQTIESCPPHLSLLPQSGFPAAVLFGARTPAMLREIKQVVRAQRRVATVTLTGQPAFPLLPNRVRIEACDLPRLRQIAQEVDIPLLEPAVSGRLLSYSSSVEEYVNSRAWLSHAIDLNWAREDFNISALRFGGITGEAIRLTRYRHPQQQHVVRYYVVEGNRSVEVAPAWGRYYVIHKLRRRILLYDEQNAVLLLPLYCPLPRLLARGLVACSGFAPQEITAPDGQAHRAFVQIPRGYADLVAGKLGQEVTLITLSAPPESFHD